ncbi:MAG: hypothetical protein ABIP51_17890 [Bacteroidia bacterium]
MHLYCTVSLYICFMKEIKLNEIELMVILGWFNVKQHEVDITENDIDLLKRIEPLMEERFKGVFERYYERFEKNGY